MDISARGATCVIDVGEFSPLTSHCRLQVQFWHRISNGKRRLPRMGDQTKNVGLWSRGEHGWHRRLIAEASKGCEYSIRGVAAHQANARVLLNANPTTQNGNREGVGMALAESMAMARQWSGVSA
jgi:hypothetical protein